jgi:hypothetical protein
MISVYLSARLARRDELKNLREDLLAAGIECTSRWLDGEPTDLADIADMDRSDVLRADVLVTFTDPPSTEVCGLVIADQHGGSHIVAITPGTVSRFEWAHRGGRHVEFGMALAAGKVCIVVGPRENFAHHSRDVRVCADWDECLGALMALNAAAEIGLDASERKAIALTYGSEDVPE